MADTSDVLSTPLNVEMTGGFVPVLWDATCEGLGQSIPQSQVSEKAIVD
ncbi:hypothetical protein EYZ11_004439 [Aspergillus tanneri]|uniref:Uncharacterized protein n=1 Tax=Aspergillus tanneri TaxID=1220188 RepID=A0A4S3JKJ7_9EURO|nr:hypothetical protein EYZ11_004439 [Aspergillus tanneri]